MLQTRLVAAACIIAPLLALVWADHSWNFQHPGIWLFPVAVLIWSLAAGELRRMLSAGGVELSRKGSILAMGPVFLSPAIYVYWPLLAGPRPPGCPLGYFGWPMLGLTLAVGVNFVVEMWRFRPGEGKSTIRLAAGMLVACYLGIPFAFVVALRLHEGNAWGMLAILSLLVIVKMSDAGAYGAGRIWGKRKLAPQLSPNKTVEGAIGGLVVAGLAAVGFRWSLVPWLLDGHAVGGSPAIEHAGGVAAWGLYGLLLAIAAMGGDLGESLIKRDLGVKDSSRWLPGLGGMLDLVDSILFAAPVAYFCWIAGLIGPS